MMRRREHEADAGFGDAARDCLGSEIDFDAERTENVGGAGTRRQRAVAMLGDRHAGAGDNEGGAGGDIKRARGVAAGADHIDGVRRRCDAQHLGTHDGNGAGNLVNGFAAHAHTHQQRAHLRRRGVA